MAAYAWEHRRFDDESGSDDELWRHVMADGEEEENYIDAEVTPGMEFVRAMLHLVYTSAISAKTFCVLMWLAGRAGIKEAVDFGLPPNSPSGHFMRKVKRKLGWMKNNLFLTCMSQVEENTTLNELRGPFPYYLGTNSLWPTWKNLTIQSPQCCKNERCRRAATFILQSSCCSKRTLPSSISAGHFPRRSSLLPYRWCGRLLACKPCVWKALFDRNRTQEEPLWLRLQGWCTFYHMFFMLHWTLHAFKRGQHPDARYDGPWEDGVDDVRKSKSNQAFVFLCCLMYIKGDWMELGVTIGLPTWQDALRPCWGCNCFLQNMFTVRDLSFENLVWAINEDEDYFQACSRCELIVNLRGEEDKKSILRYLRYDKRKDGARGRALVRDVLVNGVSLKANDRAEPSRQLIDVGALDNVATYPLEITFWRPSQETLTRRRNPIFDPELGVTPKRCLVADVLHAVFLGILLIWCRVSIWSLILGGAYGYSGVNHEHIVAAILVVRSSLMRFYTAYERENPGEILTRLADLTPSMLGKPSEQTLKTKGAETWGFALFVVSELKTHSAMLGASGQRLLHAGDMLVQTIRIWKHNPWKIPKAQAQDLDTDNPCHMAPASCVAISIGPLKSF